MKAGKTSAYDVRICRAAALLCVAASLLFVAGCARITPPPKTATDRLFLTSNRPGKTTIYYRPTNDPKCPDYQNAGEYDIPCAFPIEPNRNYDIKLERYEMFFIRYSGEKRDLGVTGVTGMTPSINITLDREIDYGRLVPPFLLIALFAYEYTRRKKVKAAKELKAELESEQRRTQEAEKRAQITSMTLNVPERIGDYKVNEMLGRGGMAAVYKVESSYGDIFAMKVPLPHVIDDAEFMKRFSHEATIGQSMNHPSIARLYDFNSDKAKGVPFICMEFVEGQSLASVIKDEAPLDMPRVLRYVKRIAEGLDYAHSKEIVHRDIKPANIMIGSKKTLKIMDFGIARASDLSRMTQTDTVLGTPMYMAPEQIDSKEADLRADLYALGVVFYELSTGQLPFDETEPMKVIMQKLASDPIPPRQHNANIHPKVERIILKLLCRDPEDRYQTAAELLADLEEL